MKNNNVGSTAVATADATELQREANNHTHTHNHTYIQENPTDLYTGKKDKNEPKSEKKKTARGIRLSLDWELSEEDYQYTWRGFLSSIIYT